MSHLSSFLFANPSFINGVAHFLDFEGNFDAYNISRTPLEADVKALYADWLAVGNALTEAMEAFSAEQGGKAQAQ